MTLLTALLLAAAAAQTPAAPPAEAVRTVATTAITEDPRVAAVDLVSVSGGRLAVRARGPAGAVVYGSELASVRDALAVLADRRLAALWPAVTDFAGRDLERQRQRLLDRTAEGVRTGVPPASAETMRQLSLNEGWALAARQRFDAMSETGRLDEGLREIRPAFARAAAGKGEPDVFAHFSLRVGVASELASQGRVEEALDMLEQGEKSRHTRTSFRGNYWVNRAAILAEAGRHSEALRWVDSARAFARKVNAYADAQVQFAWIRACALRGLGRTGEAEAEYRIVEAASGPLVRLRLRALACMGDEDRLAAELIRQLGTDEMPSKVALMLRMAQVSPFAWARPFARAAARPAVRAALEARSRPLPAEMTPALRGWAGD
jgi:tetratricopeptide (TPR) repeat protein